MSFIFKMDFITFVTRVMKFYIKLAKKTKRFFEIRPVVQKSRSNKENVLNNNIYYI